MNKELMCACVFFLLGLSKRSQGVSFPVLWACFRIALGTKTRHGLALHTTSLHVQRIALLSEWKALLCPFRTFFARRTLVPSQIILLCVRILYPFFRSHKIIDCDDSINKVQRRKTTATTSSINRLVFLLHVHSYHIIIIIIMFSRWHFV